METLGGLLAVFGAIVFPLILIIGLIKPSLFKKPDKTAVTRKELAIFCIVASLVCLGIGGALLPSAEPKAEDNIQTETQSDTDKKDDAKTEETEASTTEVEKAENTEQEALPDFGITSDEFVKNYNKIISKADKNMIINSIEDGLSVTYAPMPNNASMSGIISENGNLRGIVLGLGGSADNTENLKVMAVSLAAANAVQSSEAKEEISNVVIELIPAATKNEGESQKKIIGNVQYAANFQPSLGGIFFTIDAVE